MKRLSVAARVVVALEVVVALVLAARLLPVESWLHGLQGRLDALGPLAALSAAWARMPLPARPPDRCAWR